MDANRETQRLSPLAKPSRRSTKRKGADGGRGEGEQPEGAAARTPLQSWYILKIQLLTTSMYLFHTT